MKKLMTVLLLIIIIGGLVLFLRSRRTTPGAETSSSELPASARSAETSAVPVDAVVAGYHDLTQYISTSGTIEALRNLELTARVAGYVQSVPVADGASVDAQALLVQLDEAPVRLQLQQYRSSLFKALGELVQEMAVNNAPHTTQIRRYYQSAFQQTILPPLPGVEPAGNKNSASLSRAEYLMLARQDIPSLYAQVKQSEQDLAHCRLRAPFSGIISEVRVSPGAYVTAGTRLMRVTNLDRVQVAIDVLEEDLPYVHQGSPLDLVAGQEAVTYHTTVTGVSPTIDPTTRTGKAYANLTNTNHVLKDGQFVEVRLAKQTFQHRLLVPREAVLTRTDRDLVFVVEGGLAKWHYIEQGVQNDREVEILSGVAPGDTVIVGGHYSLAHEASVAVRMVSENQLSTVPSGEE